MAKQKRQVNRDHDIFIKGILSLNDLVLLLLNRYIPDDLKQFMDFSTLKPLSDAHIDNKLVAQYSDSIQECALLKAQLPKHLRDMPDLPNFRFCFLWEHKSSKPNEPIEGQVERYRYAIIGSDLKNKRKPSLIIPILIYHGETKWVKKMIFEDYEPFLPIEILKYLPQHRYIIIDISEMTTDEIEKMIDLKVLRGAFMALKNAHEPKYFSENIEEVLKFVDTSPSDVVFYAFFKMLLEYMQRRSKLSAEEFNDIVEQKLEPNMVSNIKTIFEVAEEKAELRGRQEGEAIGETKKARIAILNMLKMDMFPLEKIADILEVEFDFVLKVRDEWVLNPDLSA